MVSLDRLRIVIYLFDLELPNQSHYSYLGILATSQYDISWHGTMTDSTESVKLEWYENSETSRRHGPDTDSVSITVASLWLNSHNLNSSEELSVESKYLDKGVTGECRTLMSSVIQVRRIKFFFYSGSMRSQFTMSENGQSTIHAQVYSSLVAKKLNVGVIQIWEAYPKSESLIYWQGKFK